MTEGVFEDVGVVEGVLEGVGAWEREKEEEVPV